MSGAQQSPAGRTQGSWYTARPPFPQRRGAQPGVRGWTPGTTVLLPLGDLVPTTTASPGGDWVIGHRTGVGYSSHPSMLVVTGTVSPMGDHRPWTLEAGGREAAPNVPPTRDRAGRPQASGDQAQDLQGDKAGPCPPARWGLAAPRHPPVSPRWPYLKHGLLVLAVLHLRGGQVEHKPLHGVPVTVVQVRVGPPHHHEAPGPAGRVRLQEVQVPLLGDDGAAGAGHPLACAILGVGVPRGPTAHHRAGPPAVPPSTGQKGASTRTRQGQKPGTAPTRRPETRTTRPASVCPSVKRKNFRKAEAA